MGKRIKAKKTLRVVEGVVRVWHLFAFTWSSVFALYLGHTKNSKLVAMVLRCLKLAKISKIMAKIAAHSTAIICSVFLSENSRIPSRKFRAKISIDMTSKVA